MQPPCKSLSPRQRATEFASLANSPCVASQAKHGLRDLRDLLFKILPALRSFRAKHGSILLILLFLSLPSFGTTNVTTVQFCTDTLTGQLLNSPIRIVPSISKLFATNHTIFASANIILPVASGCGATNLMPGPYDCTIQGVSQTFTILVPNSPDVLQAADLLVTPATNTFPAGLAAYPASLSDARYAPIPTNWPGTAGQGYLTDGTNAYFGALAGVGGGGGSGLNVAAGTNLVASTNSAGTLTTLSVNAAQLTNGFIGPAQATNAANAATNGLAGALVLRNGGFSTNQYLTNATLTYAILAPGTNYLGPGTVSVAAGSHNWTISGGAHVFFPGEYMTVVNDQYLVTESSDATHYVTHEAASQTYVNQIYSILPCWGKFLDSAGNPAGSIGSGSQFMGVGLFSAANANLGRLGILNGMHTWIMQTENQTDGIRFSFNNANSGDTFVIYEGPFESLDVLSSGLIHGRFGFTNKFTPAQLGIGPDTTHGSPLAMGVPFNMVAGAGFGSNVVYWATNRITPTNTITGSLNSYTLTATAGGFANVWPGCQIWLTNDFYTVLSVSGNTVQTLQHLMRNYSGASFYINQTSQTYENVNAFQSGATVPDGSWMLQSTAVGSTPSLILNNGGSSSNSAALQINTESDGANLEVRTPGNGDNPVVVMNLAAPNTSLKIRPNGVVSYLYGSSTVGGTNTGHQGFSGDIPASSLLMVGLDNNLTNVTLSGASLSGTTLTVAGGGGSYLGAFNANQFGSNSGGVYLKSGLALTNPAVSGGGSFDGSLAFNPTTGSSLFQAGLVVTGGGMTAAGFTNSGGHVANPDAGTSALVMQGGAGLQTNATLAGGLAISGTTLSAAGVTNGGNLLFTNSSLNPALLAAGGALPALNAGSLTNYLPDASSPNLPRTLWRDGVVANPCPAPTATHYEWNDTGAKGDFIWKEWQYDFRDIAITPGLRPATAGLKNFTATQACISHVPCCPNVALIAPAGVTYGWTNVVQYTMPSFTLDETCAAYWQGRVEQWMTDPLWQPPSSACSAQTLDDGTGATGTYFPPYEEARVAPPSGAPAYPSGCGVNYTGYVAARNAGGDQIPECEPPSNGQCQYPRWVTWLNQETNCTWDIPPDMCADYTP